MPKLFALLSVLAMTASAFGQAKPDKSADVKLQKDAATEKLTKSNLKTTLVETNDLIVYTTWPEPKAKTLAASMQKVYESTFKTLKFEPADSPWPGKLTVFFIPERKEFTSFVRLVEQRKPDPSDTTSVQVRSKEPYILVGLETDSKFTEADMAGEAGAAVAEALLNTKAGVTAGAAMLPTWITTGFGKLMVLKMEGNAAKLTAFRTKVRALSATGKAAAFKASDAWSEIRTKENETVTVSVVEFLLFGPDPTKFTKVLSGYKPSDERPNPTLDQALEVADYKPDTLDAAWKAWLVKAK
jgi:hypothetical protein